MPASKATSKKTTKTTATSVRKKRQSTTTKSTTSTKKKTTRKRTKSAQATPKVTQASRLLAAPKRLLLSASRVVANPVPMLPMMQSTARYSGIFFVVFGAVYALYFSQMLYANPDQFGSTVHNSAQVAELSRSLERNLQTDSVSSSVDTNISTDDVLSPVTAVNQRPAAQFSFEPAGVFRDTVTVRVRVPDATTVKLSAFIETYRNHVELGPAQRVSADEWVYEWDTTQFVDANYRVVADITNQYTDGRPYRSSHYTYLALDNSEPEPEEDVSSDAEPVEESSSSSEKLEDDTETNSIQTTTESDVLTLQEKREAAYQELQDASTEEGATEISENQEGTQQEPINDARITAVSSSPATGTIPVTITTSPALSVNVYVQSHSNQTQARRFIGVASRLAVGDWQLQYDTTQTPDGAYYLVAVVYGEHGRHEALSKTIDIRNEPSSAATPLSTVQTEYINSLMTRATNTAAETVPDPLSTQPAENEQFRDVFNSAYQDIETDLDRILRSIEIANSYNSEIDIDTWSSRMLELRDAVLDQADTQAQPEAYRAYVREEFANTVQQQREQIQTQYDQSSRDALSGHTDTDRDGVYDYDEINVFGTDPFDPDTDNDGVLDGIEIMRGTDPRLVTTGPSVYESPIEAGVVRADILAVTDVQTASTSDTAAIDAATQHSTNTAALIRGQAIPNSFVTLFIFSQPTVVTVRTAADGSWEYRFEKELEDGTHTVYAALTDHAGRVVAKSEPFAFVKQAEAFFPAGSMVTNQPQAAETSLFSSYVFYMMMSLSVISLGLILMLIGFHIQNKRREDEAYAAV